MITPSTGTADSAQDSGRGGDANNLYAQSNDAMNSLGDALAGVNIGGGFVFEGSRNPGSASPFPLGSTERDINWGSTFVDRNKIAFGRSSSLPPEPNATPLTPDNSAPKQGIDFLLSQSPAQTLGNDVLKLNHSNLPALTMTDSERRNTTVSANNFAFGSQNVAHGPVGSALSAQVPLYGGIRQETRPTQDRDSPSCSVTGTTSSSRSVSPYANSADHDSRRTIQAYHGYDPKVIEAYGRRPGSFADEEQSGGGSTLTRHASFSQIAGLETQRLSSPFGGSSLSNQSRSVGIGEFMQAPPERTNSFPPFQMEQSSMPPSVVPPQAQVLYMAVPTPDGRGQMLQPVQMVQLPGQQFAYVVSGSGVSQGTMPDSAQQQLMILPSLPSQPGTEPPLGRVVSDSRKQPELRIEGASFILDNEDQFFANGPNALRDDYSQSTPTPLPDGSQRGTGRFASADSVSSLYVTPQRPPLDQLLGQVRRLSRDQVGCRLVQQALDEEGPLAATLILNEGLPFWGEAMVDPFGNYLFQKILEKITPEERIMLIKSVSSRLVNASLNLHGTRSVQKVVELCAMDEANAPVFAIGETPEESAADVLTRSLAPAAARLCIDSHGNHVIQRILLKLGHKHAQFVFDAVAASVSDVARHRHGCCVIQRCLDSPPSEARSHLVRRIVDKSLELMQDAYGNYVVQYVLDVCSDDDVHAVCESVVGKVSLLAIQKFSSNVMEKCLERCTDRVKEMYMQELSDPERIRELMMDPFGNYVVQRALSVATHTQAVRLVEAMRPHLIASHPGAPNGQRNGGMRNTAGGRRIMAKICRRFPNFSLTTVGPVDELYNQNKSQHRHHHNHHHHQTSSPMVPTALPTYPLQGFGGDPTRGNAPPRHSYFDTGGPSSSSYYEHMPNGSTAYPHL